MYWCSTGIAGMDAPDHGRRALGVIAGRRHHRLAEDVALVGSETPLAARRALDRAHLGLAVDLGTALARRIRQQHGDVGRVDVAVGRVKERAYQPFHVDEREALLDLRGPPPLVGHADRIGGRGIGLELLHALARARHAQIADALEADVAPPLGGKALVELERVFMHLAGRVGHVEERQEPRRVPGRARGQLITLEQHSIAPARGRQVIEDRAADVAAADHRHARMCLHCPRPLIAPARPV